MIFRGTTADALVEAAQNALMDFLRARLNAPEYAARLSNKTVAVTPSEEQAAQYYNKGAGGQPFIEVLIGPCLRHRWGEVQPNGEVKRGVRLECTFLLDMTMSDHAATQSGPAKSVGSDRKLIDAVNGLLWQNRDALRDVGLEACLMKGDTEAQRAAMKRNPHVVTCQVFAVYD